MAQVKSVKASQRFDSRGKPTVQVCLQTEDGWFRAIVPSGASKGDYEALELRDGGKAYLGNGVTKAVANVNDILGPALIKSGLDVTKQLEIDQLLCKTDGSTDKSNLGSNAILAISMAVARAGAASLGKPLYKHISDLLGVEKADEYIMPTPHLNVINGGVHSGNQLAPQEFMIVPSGAESFEQAMEYASEVYWTLKGILQEKYGLSGANVGDEGGFAPPVRHIEEALDLLVGAIAKLGYQDKVTIAIDPASSEFFRDDAYDLDFKVPGSKDARSGTSMGKLYADIVNKYPIKLLEDPFAQDDWVSWTDFTAKAPSSLEIVGDDLLATNVKRMEIAKSKSACNSLLLKINQIGTISESLGAAKLAYEYGWKIFVSHRSGETTDDFIGDLVVGIKCGHLKSGAPCRGERLAKYNRLLDIEEELRSQGKNVSYAGTKFANSLKCSTDFSGF